MLGGGQDFHFLTLKGFKDANSAFTGAVDLIKSQRLIKARYNAKLEYFYVISNHDFSNWHIHLIINRKIESIDIAYNAPVENLKASMLYLVGNLQKSLRADYGHTRRYGNSSLLNKQNMKRAFKTRIRLFKIRTRLLLLQTVYRSIVKMCAKPEQPERQISVKPEQPESEQPEQPITLSHTRPPPSWDNWLIKRSLSSKR